MKKRLLFLLISFSGWAQQGNKEFSIDFLDVRKGLLSNFVTQTISDEDNLKYFATEGGISRYDGYQFTQFRPSASHPGLENENIETLFKDRENNIWIGTKEGGLSVLDGRTGQIKSYNHLLTPVMPKRLRVLSIQQGSDGHIWVGTWGHGLFEIDPQKDKLVTYLPSQVPIYKIIRDAQGTIWYVSNRSLHRFDTKQKKTRSVSTQFLMYNLIEDPVRKKLWMVGNEGPKVHLLSYDLTTQQITEQPIGLQARFVKALAIDSKNRIWLGSWGDGLYISNSEVTQFERINTNPGGGLMENVNYSIILDIHFDKNGLAWLATSHGGVLVLYPNKGFQWVSGSSPKGPLDQNIVSIYKDRKNRLLKGSLMEGLFVRNPGGVFEKVRQIENGRVNCLYEIGETLLVGTASGLYEVPNGDFSRAIRHLPREKVTSILLDSKKRLWVGTQENGLRMTRPDQDPALQNWQIFAESEEVFTLDNNRISHVKEDPKGRIWLATFGGLNLFNEKTGRFLGQDKLLAQGRMGSVIINDLLLADGKMYCGTPAGLSVVRYDGSKLTVLDTFNQDNGLSNDFICALERDQSGRIWVSSTTNLSKFDPVKKTFLHYDRENGVMINSFHNGSSFCDAQGRMYFGGSNGVIAFNPWEVGQVFQVPEVIFTKLVVNNKRLDVGDEVEDRVILTQVIQRTQRIDLGYAQNHLSLSFAANDFLGPNNVSYEYQLDGHQNKWIRLGEKNEVDFTGLTPGTYTLRVRASRNNAEWSPEKQLIISIATPPWLSWYAFLVYGLIILGILWLVRFISKRQAQLQAELRIVQIEKQKEQELSEAKITFFTNLSHEFRTPLTLILSPVFDLLQWKSLDAGVREKLTLVESNAQRLLHLINQLLDFKKSEHGLLQLKSSRSDAVAFGRRVFHRFESLAQQKKIQFNFHSRLKQAYVEFDSDQMEMVLSNVLSNALKFTASGGWVELMVDRVGKELFFAVKDNGIGLSEIDQEKIFQRFYQVPQDATLNQVGSGIGLAFSKNIMELHGGRIEVESQLNQGTTFRLFLPAPELAQEGAVVETKEIEDAATEPTSETGKRATLLIVDDEPDIRKYLRTLLSEDYQILEASDGVEGLRLANQEYPDLILSDVMMPHMDGIALCQELKSQWSTSHIPVLLLTARSSPEFELKGLQTGADDYIAKPFNPSIIKTKIANLLESRKKLREYFLQKVRFEPNTETVLESTLDHQFLERAMQLVRENIQNEQFGIETMVDQLFMSQSTLFRKIKSLTGLSITGFIRSIKLQTAAQMILQTDLKLSQVALEAGFNDYKYFKKSFESQFGCLPSEYRAKILAEQRNVLS